MACSHRRGGLDCVHDEYFEKHAQRGSKHNEVAMLGSDRNRGTPWSPERELRVRGFRAGVVHL